MSPNNGKNRYSEDEMDNIALVKRFVKEVLNERNEKATFETISPDVIFHYEQDKIMGADRWKKEFLDVLVDAFPDLSLDIDDIIASGNDIVVRWTARGTHKNELLGVAPSNNLITISGMDWTRIADGKIVENWSNWGMSYLISEMQQELKTLRGILPLCSFCKKIRDDKNCWEQVDIYLSRFSEADISHSVCPECMKKHYPDLYEEIHPDKDME